MATPRTRIQGGRATAGWAEGELDRVGAALELRLQSERRDGTVIEAHPGDTIYTAPGEEHWHGAAPDRFMAHLVLMEGDGSDAPQTVWGEEVADSDYQAPRTCTH